MGGTNVADEKDDSADEGDLTMPTTAGAEFKPTKVNPHFLMLYGHIMACGKSYQSAIGESYDPSTFDFGLWLICFVNSFYNSVLPACIRDIPK